MPAPPARLTWAVESLDLSPDDRVLEFGCGTGVAAELVCEQLVTGHLTAIDRSASAIERTRARLAEQIAAGRVDVQRVELARFDGQPATIDVAFAVNVNVFWTAPATAECEVLRRVLKPGGVVHLVYDSPTNSDGSSKVVGPATTALERHGFDVTVARSPDGRLVRVTATLVRPAR